MKQDEFKNRYAIKLGSSVIIALLNMIIQLLLPRIFTVEEYGYYTYNLNVFTSLIAISNLSTTNAMSSKFSKRNEEIGLVRFYLAFWIGAMVILSFAVMLLYPVKLMQETFAGQTLMMVMLALESIMATKFLGDNIGLFDAMAISRYPAIMQIILKVVLTIIVLAGYFAGRLNLGYFYISQIVITVIIIIIMLKAFFKEQRRLYPKVIDQGIKAYAREYFEFCRPLVISTIFAQLVIIFMNWALMKWSGVANQAMFGAAWQLNTLITYVFSPYAELSRREFAVLCNDQNGLQKRWVQSLKLMIWVTCYIAIYIGVEAPWLLKIIYGEKYANAAFVTLLIMIYTVYQAWGQLEGAYYVAAEKSRVYAMVSASGQLLTVGLVFLFQIPNFIFPNSLGAVGIAMTYLVSNAIMTNVSLALIAKEMHIGILKSLMIQVPAISLCTASSFLLRGLLEWVIPGETIGVLILKVLISGIVYTGIVLTAICVKPDMLGVTRTTILNAFFWRNRKK